MTEDETAMNGDADQGFMTRLATASFVGSPCSVCGHPLHDGDMAQAVGSPTVGDSGGVAHGACWRNMINIVRRMAEQGQLAKLLTEVKL